MPKYGLTWPREFRTLGKTQTGTHRPTIEGDTPTLQGNPITDQERGNAAGKNAATDGDEVAVVERVGDLTLVRSAEEFEAEWAGDTAPEADQDTARAVHRSYRWLSAGMMITDAAVLLVSLIAVHLLRPEVTPLTAQFYVTLFVAPLVWVGVFYASGLYAPQHLSPPEEFRRLIGAASMGIVLLVLGSFWTQATLARSWVGITWLLALSLEMVTRRGWHWHMHKLKAAGRLAMRTFVIGTNDEAIRLRHSLDDRALGFRPVGFATPYSDVEELEELPVFSFEDLEDAVAANGVECLFVASTAVGSHQMMQLAQCARRTGTEIKVSANLPQILTSRLAVQPMGDVMTLSLRPVRLSGPQMVVKRGFDLAIGSLVLLAVSPVLMVVSAAIRLTSRGPALFKQERVTMGGRAFTVYKFRTMQLDADHLLKERGIDKSAAFFKVQDDPRLTTVGSFLRRSSLDELPQLLNVIKGDMSLVGPRPLPLEQVSANQELLAPRHEVRAGVTGWWQVNGRSDVDPKAAVQMDLFYIENWSLALDMYVLLKTAGIVIARRGAV